MATKKNLAYFQLIQNDYEIIVLKDDQRVPKTNDKKKKGCSMCRWSY